MENKTVEKYENEKANLERSIILTLTQVEIVQKSVSMMCKYTLCSIKLKKKVELCYCEKEKDRVREREEENPTPLFLLPFLFSSEGDVQTTQLRASGLTLWDVHSD